MKTYYCKNGEKVKGEIIGDELIIYYKNKKYQRSVLQLGKTLFEYDPIVTPTSLVQLTDNATGEIKNFQLYHPDTETKYYGMGGSFYGARVKTEVNITKALKEDSGIINISCDSPLGKALLNHRIDDVIKVLLPSNRIDIYTILKIT
ncbi:MAG: GreA/GreB family elongation factor [Ruminococcus sp.]|nr:GreA/GreB family elongation factor [Ruminococcus sp.]